MQQQGLVEHVVTLPARSFALADTATGQTVLTVLDATEFFTASGSATVDINGATYEAVPTKDDENGDYLTLSPALVADVALGDPVTLVPAGETKWADVSTDDYSDGDLIRCRVPLSYKALTALADGPYSGDARPMVWFDTDPEPHLVDPPNQTTEWDASTTPIVVSNADGESVRVDGDGVTAYTNDPIFLWRGEGSVLAGLTVFGPDPEGVTEGFVYSVIGSDLFRYDISTGRINPNHPSFTLPTLQAIAASSKWLYGIDGSDDIRRWSLNDGSEDTTDFPIVGDFDYITCDEDWLWALNDPTDDIRKFSAVDGTEDVSDWPLVGSFGWVKAGRDGFIYAQERASAPSYYLRKYAAADGTEDTTGDWPLASSFLNPLAAGGGWVYQRSGTNITDSLVQFSAADGAAGAFVANDGYTWGLDAFGTYLLRVNGNGGFAVYSAGGGRVVSWSVTSSTGQAWSAESDPVVNFERLSRSTSTTVADAIGTSIALPDSIGGSGGFWSSDSGFEIAESGLYSVAGSISWAANSTGYRRCAVHVNGDFYTGSSGAPAPSGVTRQSTAATTLFLNAGDFVDLVGTQNSGGDLSVTSAWLSISRLGVLAA